MLELQEAVSKPMWGLRTELRSSRRAVSTEPVPPGLLPQNFLKKRLKIKPTGWGTHQYPSTGVAKTGKLRFKASLSYMQSSRIVWATEQDPVSKKKF